ncbi:MAG: ATP synthase F1 subunit gamma [Microgenomates group bacterium]|jgi:F-type H+-transporting ATPase subunit gamma
MASSRELRRRIKSIKNTAQITKAMQMVAATKMRKAQNQAISARPYIATLSQALLQVCDKLSTSVSPLLRSPETGKSVVVAISTDKGLCGALNTNLFRVISSNHDIFTKETIFLTKGKKVRDFLVRSGRNLEADFENSEHVDFSQATEIRKYLIQGMLTGEIKEAYLLYTDFVSTLRQEPKLIKILPFDSTSVLEQCKFYSTNISPINSEFLFEPNPVSVMEYALVHLLDTQIYQALLESKASEHSARMIAMQNATENAKELVTDLTLSYNQARQSAITRELLEIASAGAALEAA